MRVVKLNLLPALTLLTLFTWYSCREKTNRQQQIVKTIVKEKKVVVDTPSKSFINDHPVMHPDSIGLFDLSEDWGPKDDSVLFVSVSDVGSISEKADSNIISKLLGKKVKEKRHIDLTTKYRNKLLASAHIRETDSLFIYDYAKDVLLSFPVNSLNTIACLNIYSEPSDGPHPDYYYMLGFKIDRTALSGLGRNYFSTTYVAIGSKNPFNKGQMHPIVWEKIKPQEFPSISLRSEEERELNGAIFTGTYSFKFDDYRFYLKQYLKKSEQSRCELLLIGNSDGKIIYNELYHESEGESPAPLSFVNNKNNSYEQWVGCLLKDRPPLILGFEYLDFGCPALYYINQSRGYVPLYCDSRH